MSVFGPLDIIKHLKDYLPQITDDFSDNPAVTGEIIAGTPQVLRITQSSHGKSVGQKIAITEAVIPNEITAFTPFTDPVSGDAGITFTVALPHDLTTGYSESVTLSGFTNANINGTFDIYEIASTTTFAILTAESVGSLNGNEVQQAVWEIGAQGVFEISNVVDADTYDVELTGLPTFTTGAVTSLAIVGGYRISLAQDIDRAQQMYTKVDSNEDWLYMIMEDATTSRDYNQRNDSIAAFTEQNESRLKIINRFSLVVLHKVSNQLTAQNAIQKAWTTQLEAILAVMYTFTLPGSGDTTYMAVPAGHGSTIYNTSVYGHAYEFEFTYELTQESGFVSQFPKTRAFRDIELNLLDPADDSVVELEP